MKLTHDNEVFDVFLCDDGTLDTVIEVNNIEHRFDCEYASYWRDDEGALSPAGLEALAIEVIESDERYWKD